MQNEMLERAVKKLQTYVWTVPHLNVCMLEHTALPTDDGRVRERCDVRTGRRGSHSGKCAQIFPKQEVRDIPAVPAGALLLSLTTSCVCLLQPTRIVLRV